MKNYNNVYEHSLALTNTNIPLTADRDWNPKIDSGFKPTRYAPGSQGKIDVMVDRLEKGYPIFHEDDSDRFNADEMCSVDEMPIRFTVGLLKKMLENDND
jgi:hypothetical protein